jgi:hypothetical protein
MAGQNSPDNQHERLFQTEVVCCWERLIQEYKDKFSGDDGHRWIFRAQKTGKASDFNFGKWSIKSALENATDLYQTNVDLNDVEKELIRSFQRQGHHYVAQAPPEDDLAEWLSLMRHYGGPTRLIDWTYSFYVALYFAVNECRCNDSKPEMWALDAKWLDRENKSRVIERTMSIATQSVLQECTRDSFRFDTELANEVIRRLYRGPRCVLYQLSPFRQNERIRAQQGTFIFPGRITQDSKRSDSLPENGVFFDNLKVYKHTSEHLHRIILDIKPQERNRILKDLDRMNINQATLFPDLEGFAESLKRRLAYPDEKFGLRPPESP